MILFWIEKVVREKNLERENDRYYEKKVKRLQLMLQILHKKFVHCNIQWNYFSLENRDE